uniref:Uncharacterized protein n=1 Tax=Brassica campestris TaxID=3711 RepID=A0A3P6DW96_BRACM|nr:unnamed protein product [Brassica rapa]
MTRNIRRGGKKNLGTYISRQASYSKTRGNAYGFWERIPRVLGSCG